MEHAEYGNATVGVFDVLENMIGDVAETPVNSTPMPPMQQSASSPWDDDDTPPNNYNPQDHDTPPLDHRQPQNLTPLANDDLDDEEEEGGSFGGRGSSKNTGGDTPPGLQSNASEKPRAVGKPKVLSKKLSKASSVASSDEPPTKKMK